VGGLAALAAMVPLAAAASGDTGAALASPAASAVQLVVPDVGPARTSRDETSAPEVDWRDSQALGTPNAGGLQFAVRLPARGVGFYTYDPPTSTVPSPAWRRHGTDRLVRELIAVGTWWRQGHAERPRLGIGDLSQPDGGPFHGPGVGHASHQNGLDVDIRLPRRDGLEGPAHAGNYDRELAQALVDRFIAQGASLVLIGPSLDLSGPGGVVVRWPNHDDHLHVRFPNPG